MRPAAILVLLLLVAPASAAEPREALVDQVRDAIKQGKQYLIKQQTPRGDWELEAALASARPGGMTALALLALLHSAEPLDNKDYKKDQVDEVIRKGIAYLKGVPQELTYVVSLQTMVYCLAGEDKQLIERNVKWLLDARQMSGGKLLGWTYHARGERPDSSNTQYALLALHEAQVAGIKIDRAVWDSIREYYLNGQTASGSYTYQNGDGRPLLTMTTAGLCGLLIAGGNLNADRETPNGDGTWKNCGDYLENRAVANALEWLGTHFPSAAGFGRQPHLFYALYGIERAGRLTGLRFLGEHDWYRVGCEYLVGEQRGDGAWQSNADAGGPVVSASFALLFLSKGRTPILISKLTHDGVGRVNGVAIRLPAGGNRDDLRNDWNNDRSDARHLVEFAGRELFKRKPMGWQVFNAREADPRISADDLAAELLQSPIAYFNGHLTPEFSGREEAMLQAYVRNGGLIFAEACCGKEQFRVGFEALMKKLFPGHELRQLAIDHPVWTAAGKFAIPPAQRKRFPLYGIEMGCKTVVIFSPRDLSCHWESNQWDDKGDSELAFRVGANLIAYATGLEPPKPRLTQVHLAPDESKEPLKVPRGFLKVGLLKHDGDSNVAADAMPTLMLELRTRDHLDVALKSDEVWPTGKDVANYKFLYMHGRKTFSFSKDQLGDLRYDLEHGGLLFADACCGSSAFDRSFRDFIAALWPDKKYELKRIPVNDALFGKSLNGTAIKTVRCRRETAGKRDTEYQDYEPFLEGVKIKDRWAVIYSRWDIGCALEKHRSPNCLGHDYESAVKIGRAAVLYHLR